MSAQPVAGCVSVHQFSPNHGNPLQDYDESVTEMDLMVHLFLTSHPTLVKYRYRVKLVYLFVFQVNNNKELLVMYCLAFTYQIQNQLTLLQYDNSCIALHCETVT